MINQPTVSEQAAVSGMRVFCAANVADWRIVDNQRRLRTVNDDTKRTSLVDDIHSLMPFE